jgi:hypothetical protein
VVCSFEVLAALPTFCTAALNSFRSINAFSPLRTSTEGFMTTAGLSRAYAVLRQLDVLRTVDILHPLPTASSPGSKRKLHRQCHEGSNVDDDVSKLPLRRDAREARRARQTVEVEGEIDLPSLRESSPMHGKGEGAASSRHRFNDAVHSPHPLAQNPTLTTSREACLMPPPPSYSDAMSEAPFSSNPTAETSFVSGVSRSSKTCEESHAYAPRRNETASSSPRISASAAKQLRSNTGVRSRFEARHSSSDAFATCTPPRALRNTSAGHIYLRPSPKSSPRRAGVLSPVVLPALSTSEADHMLAHASSSLERYFDKDDMQSVLASVAAAAGETDVRHRLSLYTPKTAAPMSGGGFVKNGAKGRGGTSSAFVNNSAFTLSSLTHSPTSHQSSYDAYGAEYRRGEGTRWGRAQNTRCNAHNDRPASLSRRQHGGSPVEGLQPITITPSVERLLDAVQTSSQHSAYDEKRDEKSSPAPPKRHAATIVGDGRKDAAYNISELSQLADSSCNASNNDSNNRRRVGEQVSPIAAANDSPRSLTHEQQRFSPDLSSFYTANGRSQREENGGCASAPQASVGPASMLHLRSRQDYCPIPAPRDGAACTEYGVIDVNGDDRRQRLPRGLTRPHSATASDVGSAGLEEPRTASLDRAVENARLPTPVDGSGGDDRQLRQKEEKLYREANDCVAADSREGGQDSETSGLGEQVDANADDPSACSTRGDTLASPPALMDNSTEDAENYLCDDLPREYIDALPFLDYLARVNAAFAAVLLKELAAMGDAWAAAIKQREETAARNTRNGAAEGQVVRNDEDEVVDCLALSLLLNKPAALQHIAVPLLRTQLQNALRLLREHEEEVGSASESVRTLCTSLGSGTSEEAEEEEGRGRKGQAKSPALAARTAHFNNVICAVVGLGSAASSLLPMLLHLLLQLPPPTSTSLCDVRLVGLAIRTCGAAEGLQALTRIVEERREATHVLTAAAYAISSYAYELAGHTSVVCVPAGTLQRARGEEAKYRVVPDRQLALAASGAVSLASLGKELQPLWSGSPPFSTSTSTTGAPTVIHLVHVQSPPPYRPTHIIIDAEAARQSLRLYIASNVFCVRRDHPYVMVLLDDALNSDLLCPVLAEASSVRTFKPIWDRLRRELHHVLCRDQTTPSVKAGCAAALGLRLPLLPYSMQDFFADEKDMLFAVESALVHALVSPAAPLFQEQALLSLCTLPPEARVHVVQPLTDFFLKAVRRFQLRHTVTMRRIDRDKCNGAEGAAEEAVVVAAAIAASKVCVNPLAPTASTSGCIAALVPVFKELLQASQWRVRHAACIGLARVGPYTTDPASVVDVFLSLLTPAAASSFLGNTSVSEGHLPALQPATIVWCLAQQQQGGVRALLRVLQDTHESPPVHNCCALQLADVDVCEACQEVDQPDTPESDALLDQLVQVLGKLIAMQGALEENTVLLCVRALAEVVHRAATVVHGAPELRTAALAEVPSRVGVSPSIVPCVLPLQSAHLEQEAVTYFQTEPINSCFTVLTSVMEAALLPTNVLKALCLYLCKYGGAHGELYVCEMLLEDSSVVARSAAAFGLRACGAKVIRSVVLGMNDVSFEVRREALETMEAIGAAKVLTVLQHRPAEHRHQVLAALRDCLLQDAERLVALKAANTVYRALAREGHEVTELRSW